MPDRATDRYTAPSLVSREEWLALSQVRAWPIVRAAAGTWLCVAASFAVWATYPHPLTLVGAFVVVATRQHALNNLVHEAAHYSISRRKVLNDWISDALFAAPHLISTQRYRQKHLLHHSDLGHPAIDTESKPRYLIRGAGFVRHTVLSLCGVAAYEAMRSYVPAGALTRPHWRFYLLVPVTNGALFGYTWWLRTPLAYFYLWLLPLVTLTMYISTLRVIAEHQPEEYAARGVEDLRGHLPRFTRSIPAGVVERFFFGPVNFCYHHEHHLAPGIPFCNLPRLHCLLKARGFYAPQDDRVGDTYLGTLYRLVFPAHRPQAGAPPERS